MSDFNWSIFDRIHPSTKSVTAALTAPAVGKTRPALKWAAAVGTLTAVAAAVALLLTFGPFGQETPPVEGTLPAGEKIVAKMGDYPVTEREMTAYMLSLSLKNPGTVPSCEDAAAACVKNKIAQEFIAGTRYELRNDYEKDLRERENAKYEKDEASQAYCRMAGIDRQEWVDCWVIPELGAELKSRGAGAFAEKYKADHPDLKTPDRDLIQTVVEEYYHYLDESLSTLSYQPKDETFLTALERRMSELPPYTTLTDPDPQQDAQAAFDQALAKLNDGRYADAQMEFEQLEKQYPGLTQAAAYAQFCLALRIWNGDTSADRDALDLVAALPAVNKAAEGYGSGKWYRKGGKVIPLIPDLSADNAILIAETKGLYAYGYEVRFLSPWRLRLIGEEDLAGEYLPYPDEMDPRERNAIISEFLQALLEGDEELLTALIRQPDIAGKLAGLELADLRLWDGPGENGFPNLLHLEVTGGAFGPIPTGGSDWWIDAGEGRSGGPQVFLCPREEDPTLRWYDQYPERAAEFDFCTLLITELGLFDTVEDCSLLPPAWLGERGNYLANVFALLYKDQNVTVHGEDVAAADLTRFIETALGVTVTDFTGSRQYTPGDTEVWLSRLSGFYSNCGLVDHTVQGDLHTLTLRYYADLSRLAEAVTLECSIRDLGGGEYRMLSSKVVERGDYPPLCEAF